MDDKLQQYADLKRQLAEVVEALNEIQPEVLNYVLENGKPNEKGVIRLVVEDGEFHVQNRKKWTYSKAIQNKIKKLSAEIKALEIVGQSKTKPELIPTLVFSGK